MKPFSRLSNIDFDNSYEGFGIDLLPRRNSCLCSKALVPVSPQDKSVQLHDSLFQQDIFFSCEHATL